MNFEQSISSSENSSKSSENKSSMDIYYEDISKKVLDVITFSEDETEDKEWWKNRENKIDKVILKKIKEKLNDPDFKIKVKNIWNDPSNFINFEEQEDKIVRGLIVRLKEEIFNQ